MKVHARDLAIGDVLRVNDWHLHIVAIEREGAVAVLTAEFGFLIHFMRNDVVDVQRLAAAA
jgi:hypothetical protein